ncbi:MAG TPA: magnesium/cobalt transporter CorA [Phycisphaerales bacterium]|nr:magnesium/cobalt transporter CorA [Phycisphaerales bacterium]
MKMHMPRMRKLRRNLKLKPPGTAPETLVADPAAPKPHVSAIGYGGLRAGTGSKTEHREIDGATIEQVRALRGEFARVWVNVDGLGDAEVVRSLGELFGLHKLALEDVLSTHQRAKADEFDDHLFIVIREPSFTPTGEPASSRIPGQFDTDQISMFLGSDFVVTFQEMRGDCLDPVRARIRQCRGRICTSGPDFLVYSILDAIVDSYFPVLEAFGERLEDLESQAVESPSTRTVHQIHAIKRELLVMRRTVWPAREAISSLVRDESPLVGPETRVYMRDAYDHMVQLIDILENYRELGSDLMDIYISSQSHRLNEVMKVLTVLATLFMPLTFIVGVYGMNFDRSSPYGMPELGWKYGYPLVWAIMLSVSGGMLVWFWRRGWIGPGGWGR